jgi:Holliday junction resolvase
MAVKPEVAVKKKVLELLKKHKAYYFTPVTSGFGSSGVPDFVACIKGKFVGIEVKAGKNKPTALQDKNLTDIMGAGGVAIVVNESGLENLRLLLEVGLPTQGALFDMLLTTGELK